MHRDERPVNVLLPNQLIIKIGALALGEMSLPSQYFFRQCHAATDADEKGLRRVVESVGDDSIVVSTDYPHSDGLFPEARAACHIPLPPRAHIPAASTQKPPPRPSHAAFSLDVQSVAAGDS